MYELNFNFGALLWTITVKRDNCCQLWTYLVPSFAVKKLQICFGQAGRINRQPCSRNINGSGALKFSRELTLIFFAKTWGGNISDIMKIKYTSARNCLCWCDRKASYDICSRWMKWPGYYWNTPQIRNLKMWNRWTVKVEFQCITMDSIGRIHWEGVSCGRPDPNLKGARKVPNTL